MKKAFTLIELLVVIAIIAILAAMLMPALTAAKKQAQRASCSANVHNLALGWAMFRKDFDGDYTREACDAWDCSPESIADIGGLGYIDDVGVYKCPSFDGPFARDPELIVWYTEEGIDPEGTVTFTGEIHGSTYFADEARIPREPLPQRAILADGIEMVTMYGKEPSNHADDDGRAAGANVLFVDMAVEWAVVYRDEHTWVMDQVGVEGPGGIGVTLGEDWYPHATGGTWRRYGYIQNQRLLKPGSGGEGQAGGGAGKGEDDLDNAESWSGEFDVSAVYDVDDIYYVDCTSEEFGDSARWGFISYGRGARCADFRDKNERDCSLAGGHLWYWRGAYYDYGAIDEMYAGFTWGWPDQLTVGY